MFTKVFVFICLFPNILDAYLVYIHGALSPSFHCFCIFQLIYNSNHFYVIISQLAGHCFIKAILFTKTNTYCYLAFIIIQYPYMACS